MNLKMLELRFIMKRDTQQHVCFRTTFENYRLLMLFLFFFIVSLSCTRGSASEDLYGKRSYPYVLREVFGNTNKPGMRLIVSDIDCDLRDEFLYVQKPAINIRNKIDFWDEKPGIVSWVLNSSNELGKPFCANLDQEGDLEIMVPEKIENSIFLNVYNSGRRLLHRFCACEGIDRNDDGRWDGVFEEIVTLDLNSDGYLEIVVAVRSSYDLHPRGVWAFNWNEEREIWRFETGTQMVDMVSADVDGDRFPEIVCSTCAPSNGSSANGTDDNHSYVIVLDDTGELKWVKSIGGIFSRVDVYLGDSDPDGGLDIVAIESSGYPEEEKKSRVIILNGKMGHFKKEKAFSVPLSSHEVKDMNNDGQLEIFLLFGNGQICVLDSDLKIKKKFNDPQKSTRMLLEDLNDDGKCELILSGKNKKTVVLDNEVVDVLTVFDDGGDLFSVRPNPGEPKRLALMCPNYLYFLDMKPNPDYNTSNWHYIVSGLIGVLVLFLMFSFRKRFFGPPSHVESGLLEAIPGGIIIVDKRGKITSCNQHAQDILELKKTKCVGTSYQELFDNDDRKDILKMIEMSQNESWEEAQEVRVKVGGMPKELLVSISALKDKKDTDVGKLVMIDDVSELVMSQRALAWATVAQQAAHKIKNPLTMMQLAIDRIQSVSRETFGVEAKKLDRYIETNRNQINSLLKITDAFMQIADLKPPHFQPTNINHVIESISTKYAESFSKGIALTLNLNQDLPNVKADEHQMVNVFENVITNALEAMGEKGSLSVSTGVAQRFQDSGAKPAVKEYVQVEITDTGRGIPSEDMDKLFDQFFSRRKGGTGMGLAIVKKIVDDHEGHIHVESTLGVGTTVTVLIPVW